jgi:uncharacterized protein (TIGR00161 family)
MPQVLPRVHIKESGTKIPKPCIVVGVPDVGLVGTISCSYIIEQLKLEPRGYIDSDLVPQVMVVQDSAPNYPIQIYGKDGIIVVVSEVPLSSRLSLELAKEISRWARSREAKVVVGVSGAPSTKREESQGEERPTVVGVSNDDGMRKGLRALGALPFEHGLMTGFYASLIKFCTLNGQANVTLLGESMLQFPDPASAAAVIDALGGILPVKIDTKPLLKESEEVRIKTRELMQQTQQATQQTGGSPSAYR